MSPVAPSLAGSEPLPRLTAQRALAALMQSQYPSTPGQPLRFFSTPMTRQPIASREEEPPYAHPPPPELHHPMPSPPLPLSLVSGLRKVPELVATPPVRPPRAGPLRPASSRCRSCPQQM
eukprot:TRINITY_DN1357_c0_g1_i1.p3 TRINITY_DN1357_c0_g1~~TRINITY_DN1357_c0_g1_i1.p3  ORF type:complete len:127 (+),score=4.53 TRINITY_DN1357_c0_g1_i1:24-383(+)